MRSGFGIRYYGSNSDHQPNNIEEEDLGRLIQASKLALLGQMAAGIAHEIKTPLAVLRLECEEILRKIDALPEDYRLTCSGHRDTVVRNIDRLSSIVDQIHTMSANSDMGFCRLNLHEVLEEVEKWSNKLIDSEKVRLQIEPGASDPVFFGNTTQVEQIFLNLIHNASEAILATNQGSYIRIRTASNNGRIEIDVEDDGPGIEAEQIPQIFDPFYTTKTEGQGIGLGLSIVARVVKTHGGTIEVASKPGKGTCFHISIPHDRRKSGRET